MKKRHIALFVAIFLLLCAVRWMGVGYYSSSAAQRDLKKDLVALHGETYTGRETENGTEDMAFEIRAATFFPTNYSLRYFFGWDYKYECTVTYTTYSGETVTGSRTVTYVGYDPVGPGEEETRAYVDESSKVVKGLSVSAS